MDRESDRESTELDRQVDELNARYESLFANKAVDADAEARMVKSVNQAFDRAVARVDRQRRFAAEAKTVTIKSFPV
jgi:hypothetical protein